MDFEKPNFKGSFLQLFDWNVKSRKKLFSSKSELPEKSSQGDENVNGSTFLRPLQVHENGYGPEPSIRGRCNHGYEFPLSSDDTYGTKAPGVVARLMGLDSLPTSNNAKSCFTSFLDSQSLRDSRYSAGVPGSQDEEYIIIGDNMRNKVDGFAKNPVDGFAKNPVELMVHKVHRRPIERFQTEVLPPKSAKPISITHHRLLSPIKSPGFVPKMNASYLMEAAGKMIEQSPRARVTTHKLPSLGSSSVPFRIQDLKERVDAVEKSRRIIDSSQMGRQYNYGQYTNRHASGSVQGRVDSQDLLRANRTVKTASCEDMKRKIKAATLPERNGLTSVVDQGSASLGIRNEAKRRLVGRNQEEKQKNVLKRTPANRKSDVLKQNNQKQNCASTKEKGSLRPSIPNEKEKKPSSSVALPRPSKTVNRSLLNTDSLCKKENLHTHDSRVETSSSMTKNSSRKKQGGDRNHVSDGGSVTSVSHGRNYEIGKASKRESADRRNGMDVVSFTFTSPIKKPVPESTLSGKHVESKRNLFLTPDSCNSQSSLGLDVGGTDALSMLLEQKIKELASRVETSYEEPICSEFLSYADASTDSVPTVETISFKNSEWNSKCDLFGDKTDKCYPLNASFSSLCEPLLESMQKWQESDEAKKNRMVRHDEKELHFEYSAPVSSPELSYSEGSCKSLDSSRSISNQGSNRYLPAEALETIGWSSNGTCQGVDIELLDSASSTSVGTTSITDVTSRYSSISKDPSNWEFHYIRSVVFSTYLLFKEFALGQVQKVIPQDIFDQLENETSRWNEKAEGDLKLTRQPLFDYVEESLESRCWLLFSGGRKHLMKVRMLFHEKDWLVDELYREVSGLSGMEELIVDELVDKDMNTQLGRWTDFETETFEEGVEIGEEILTRLVDEMLIELFS